VYLTQSKVNNPSPLYSVGSASQTKYAVIVAVAISGVIFLLQVVLIVLHGYLRCLLSLSTYEWIKEGRKQRTPTAVELKY
jgi:hypothetical protein